MQSFHTKSIDETLAEVGSNRQGLAAIEVERRISQNGKNVLAEGKKKSTVEKALQQFTDPMIVILIAVAIISGIIGEIADTLIILAVVAVNAMLGLIQENKAEKAIEALQKMSSPYAKVLRTGIVEQVKTEDVVVGDIVLLEAGDFVPADIRLIESASLKIDEAALTGESVAVDKFINPLEGLEITLGDRTNMGYMGTSVVYGRGAGVITATGMHTELGKIADSIANTEESETPLQIKMSELSRVLTVAVIAICLFIFAIGVINDGFGRDNLINMFMIAVSLAVGAIPEGLVVVVTIVLSIGVTRMAKRNAIIRKLPAVETLGCAQIICSDKTGTLTQNKMTVVEEYTESQDQVLLNTAMALCNDVTISREDNTIIGEPTEKGLVEKAIKAGLNKNDLENQYPRIGEVPFDSARKLMSTLHKTAEGNIIQFTKGAPDALLKLCSNYAAGSGEMAAMTESQHTKILAANKAMADSALRVMAAAYRIWDQEPAAADYTPAFIERDLIFIGLQGMIDPVRPEVFEAIRTCRAAGIRPIMITGDHKDTAVAIARQIGIITSPEEAITGEELDKIGDNEFATAVQNYSVYARVQPQHKVRVVSAWKKLGMVTAMTGDGVNDAPALKTADIGIGMGITGTDVSKSVSALVLSDDNFSSIVSAVEEGRIIYANIRKAMQFLLSTNATEVIVIFVATFMGIRLFAPIHLLWINMVTDSLPAIALGMEKGESGIMMQPPRDSKAGLFAGGVASAIIYQSSLMSVLTLFSYLYGSAMNHEIGSTMAFLTVSSVQLFHAFNLRFQYQSLFSVHSQSNMYMYLALVVGLISSLFITYMPGVNALFKLTALPMEQLAVSILLAMAIIPIIELVKYIRRQRTLPVSATR